MADETKLVDGQQLGRSDFAYAPEGSPPSDWKLPIHDAKHAAMAAAALSHGGFRGQKVEVPTGHLAAVKAKVRSAHQKHFPDTQESDMPDGIKKDAGAAGDAIVTKRQEVLATGQEALLKGLDGIEKASDDQRAKVLTEALKLFGGIVRKGLEETLQAPIAKAASTNDFSGQLLAGEIEAVIKGGLDNLDAYLGVLSKAIAGSLSSQQVADKPAAITKSCEQFGAAALELATEIETYVAKALPKTPESKNGTLPDQEVEQEDKEQMEDGDDFESTLGKRAEAVDVIAKGLMANVGAEELPVSAKFLAHVGKLLQDTITKRGARHSAADLDHLDMIHKCAGEIMKRCGGLGLPGANVDEEGVKKDELGPSTVAGSDNVKGKGGPAGDDNLAGEGKTPGQGVDVGKSDTDIKKMADDLATLQGQLIEMVTVAKGQQASSDALKAENADLQKRLDEVERSPAGTKANTTLAVVTKADERFGADRPAAADTTPPAAIEKAFAGPLAAIRASHGRPVEGGAPR